jgi:hypothetical protein
MAVLTRRCLWPRSSRQEGSSTRWPDPDRRSGGRAAAPCGRWEHTADRIGRTCWVCGDGQPAGRAPTMPMKAGGHRPRSQPSTAPCYWVSWSARGPTRFEQRRLRCRESTPDAYRRTRCHRSHRGHSRIGLPGPNSATASGTEPMAVHNWRRGPLASHRDLDRGQRRAVAVAPPLGIHDSHPAGRQAADDGRDRSGVVADHDQDPLQAAGEQGPHGPLDQAQAPHPEQRLGATPVTDSSRSDRPAASTTPTRGNCDSGGSGWTTSARWGSETSGSGGSCGASAMRNSPKSNRVNAEGTVQGSPVTPTQARQARNGQPAAGATLRHPRPS